MLECNKPAEEKDKLQALTLKQCTKGQPIIGHIAI